jgi:hypothetical protein
MKHRSPQKLSTRTSRRQRGSGRRGNTNGGARHSPTWSPLYRGGDVDDALSSAVANWLWPPVKSVVNPVVKPEYKPPTETMWLELYDSLNRWISSITNIANIANREKLSWDGRIEQIKQTDRGIFFPVYNVNTQQIEFEKQRTSEPESKNVYTIIEEFMKDYMKDYMESATKACHIVIKEIRKRIMKQFLPWFDRSYYAKYSVGFLTPIIQIYIADPSIRNLYTQLGVLDLWNISTEHGTNVGIEGKKSRVINAYLKTMLVDKNMIESKQYSFDEYCHLILQVYKCREVRKNASLSSTWLDQDLLEIGHTPAPTDKDYRSGPYGGIYGYYTPDGFFKFNNQGNLFFTYGLMSGGLAMYPFFSFYDDGLKLNI